MELGFPGHVFGKIFLAEKKLVSRKKLLHALLKPELNKEIFSLDSFRFAYVWLLAIKGTLSQARLAKASIMPLWPIV
jgi:hypothetical protein